MDCRRKMPEEMITDATARLGQVQCLKYLREGFWIDEGRYQSPKTIMTLRMSIREGQIDCLKFLREGFGLTFEDARAKVICPLQLAASYGKLYCLKYLREGFGLTVDDSRAN